MTMGRQLTDAQVAAVMGGTPLVCLCGDSWFCSHCGVCMNGGPARETCDQDHCEMCRDGCPLCRREMRPR